MALVRLHLRACKPESQGAMAAINGNGATADVVRMIVRFGMGLLSDISFSDRTAITHTCRKNPTRSGGAERYFACFIDTLMRQLFELRGGMEYGRSVLHDLRQETLLPHIQPA